ncbi:MAG: hypothetical protein Q8L40_04140 [Burkholderiales bacterium]|nr:hypothetical protein [Burkholderiales bacterium]
MLLIVSLTAVPVAVVIFLIWSYRKKVAHKTVASQERYSQLFSASQPDAAAGIRHIRVNVVAIPRREEMHFLVYGTHPRQDS